MLKIRIKDFDFLGGVAAVYLKNQNDLKNTLDDFIVSKDFLSIYGYYGLSIEEMYEKINTSEALIIYYIRNGYDKDELLEESKMLSAESLKSFMYFYNTNSFMETVELSNYDPLASLFSSAYYGLDPIIVSKIIINLNEASKKIISSFMIECLNKIPVNEEIYYYPIGEKISGYKIYLLDINNNLNIEKLDNNPKLGDIKIIDYKILCYVYNNTLDVEILNKSFKKINLFIKENKITKISIINRFYYIEIDKAIKKYFDLVEVNSYIFLNEMERKAYNLMLHYHFHQIDKNGEPYYLHPLFVGVHANSPKTRILGFLHDTLEDTSISLNEVKQFGDDIFKALLLLTHGNEVPYMDYIKKLALNPYAKEVKLCDLLHNTLVRRNNSFDLSIYSRIVYKYEPAIKFLIKK